MILTFEGGPRWQTTTIMTTGADAVSGSITTSRITGGRAAAMKSRISAVTAANSNVTATAEVVTTASRTGADIAAGVPASLTGLTITTVMNMANARASLTTSEAMKANTASLITAAGAGVARSGASSSAPAMRSGLGSATRRPIAGGGGTRCGRGCTRGAARAVTGVPTSASARTSTTI